MIDAVAVAEVAQDALDRFGELTVCAEFGDGWSCTEPATPDGPPRIIGRDDRGGVDAAVAVRRRPLVRRRNAGTRSGRVSTMKRIRMERSRCGRSAGTTLSRSIHATPILRAVCEPFRPPRTPRWARKGQAVASEYPYTPST